MTAADTIETLLKLGLSIRDAIRKGNQSGKSVDWQAFLQSPEFAAIKSSVTDTLGNLKSNDLDAAMSALKSKEDALLGNNQLTDLSTDKLIQYSQLQNTRLMLAARQVQVAANGGFFGWLTNDALPVLLQTAQTVIPLVL
jgi:hypothetical protein